eukprot:COSAG06_NODE_2426_length_6899_cov_7.350147_7_plen_99_part_00
MRKTPFSRCHFNAKNDPFAQTGFGTNTGKVEEKRALCAGSTRADVAAVCVVAMLPGATGAVNTTFEMDCEKPVADGGPAVTDKPSAALFEALTSQWGE